MRIVLDSSVVIAAAQPSEPSHEESRDFVQRARRAPADEVGLYAPPELWLEVHVVEQRLARSRRSAAEPGEALRGLDVELVAPPDAAAIVAFLEHLTRRMRGRRPMANATDLVYLWAAWSVDATVVTLDRGLRDYHGLVCDVSAPEHLLRERGSRAARPR